MITIATVCDASVIAVVKLPGSMKSFLPESSRINAACSSLVSLIPRANTLRSTLSRRRAGARLAAAIINSVNPITRRIAVAINPTASFGRTRDVGPAVVDALTAAGRAVLVLREPNAELLRLAVAGPLLRTASTPSLSSEETAW